MQAGESGRPNIYEYLDYRIFLRDFYERSKKRNRNFSFRYIATRLKLRSPAAFSMILGGKRHPGVALCSRISRLLNLNAVEDEYFRSMVELARGNSSRTSTSENYSRLEKLNPERNTRFLADDVFAIVSQWHVFVLREVLSLRDYRQSLVWIRHKLRGKVSIAQIRDGLERLERLKLIRREGGRYIKVDDQTSTIRDVPSEAVKAYHHSMLTLAQESLHEFDPDSREIGASTFNIRESDLPQVKRELMEWRRSFSRKYEAEDGEAVFQLNLQFFPLTRLRTGG